jgi:hypothetical protein
MLKELDSRVSNGLSVTLLVETEGLHPVIRLQDLRSDLNAEFRVPDSLALDAFRHPFYYLPSEKVAA